MRLAMVIAAVSVLFSTGCAMKRGEPVSEALRVDTPQLARGRQAYMTFCNKCHPGGEKGLGPAINNKPLPAFLIRTQVRNGLGAMPSFSKELLPDDRLEDIIAYIKLLRKE